MEESKKKISIENDKDIIFTKAIKAGKRIYYLDVKKNRKDELYLAVTESKKVYSDNDTKVVFEKHKIFLYQEDFEKFTNGLNEALDFIRLNQSIPEHQPRFPEYDETSRKAENDGDDAETVGKAPESVQKGVGDFQEEAEGNSTDKPEGNSKSNDEDLNITF